MTHPNLPALVAGLEKCANAQGQHPQAAYAYRVAADAARNLMESALAHLAPPDGAVAWRMEWNFGGGERTVTYMDDEPETKPGSAGCVSITPLYAHAAIASQAQGEVVVPDESMRDAIAILCEVTEDEGAITDDMRMDHLCSVVQRIAALSRPQR